ncbi:MAG: hypothetical protein WBG50_02620, partial [Desulfomonilaceae bacterium]
MLVSPSQPFSKPRRTKHVQLYFATTSTQLPDEPEFMLVSMKSKKSPPDVQRIHDPAYIQQNAIQRIQEIIADVYGDLATK